MSTFLRLLFGLVVLFFVFGETICAAAETKAPQAVWQKKFDSIVSSSKIPTKSLGLVITSSDKDIASLNADKPMTPASLTKIATAAAVLQKFPIGYQFVTEILADHEPVGESLNGNIYLRGAGDAGFVSESMWFLVNEFVRSGVKDIKGDLVVDDSLFDSVRRDPSRDQAAIDRAYDSPIGAMTFNWSSVSIFVRPGTKTGEAARVYADPENDYIKVVNKARTASSGESTIVASNETLNKKGDAKDGETIVVSGSIPVGAKEIAIYKSITQPDVWAGYNLKSFLKQRGITLHGSVKSGVTPSGAKTLAADKSRSIGELVNLMMKFSNNYVAEILTKDLGAFTNGRPGTMEKGAQAVRDFLKKEVGLDDIVYENPSGLSRQNSFRPRDLLRVLQYVEKHNEIYPEYLVSLPIGGVDGTLHKRMHQSDVVGSVRAKTGHLTGVTGLAGYVGTKKGQRFQFSFLYNGSADESPKAQELFDKLLYELQSIGDET